MRFLHTADWHVGKMIRSRLRLEEHGQVLHEILDIAVRERVDCVLVAGDVFDSRAPSPEAERVVYSFFAELMGRGIAAIVIGGNHDHPKRLNALRGLLDPMRIFLRPEPQRPADGGVITFHDARIAVLPFVSERKIVDAWQLFSRPEEDWYKTYTDRVAAMIERLCAGFAPNTVNILLAHVYARNAEASGSEWAIHLGEPYEVSPARFPSSAHYVALGHLHRPQEVSAPALCHYAGSPLQLDFGEAGQAKRVVIVDARPGRPAHIESVPLTSGRRLRDLRGRLEELQRQAAACGDDYLRVTLVTDAPAPGLADRVREILPYALTIHCDYPRSEPAPAPAEHLPPRERFALYYQSQQGAPPPEELLRMFDELYEEAQHAAD